MDGGGRGGEHTACWLSCRERSRERTLLNGHVRNDTFDGILPLLLVLAVQIRGELEVLSLPGATAKARHWTWLVKIRF